MLIMIIMMNLFFMITIILLLLNFLISKKLKNNREKNSPFECGFDPLSSTRLPFSIQFYMISIIFLIFDVEIIIFFPMIPQLLNMEWSKTIFFFIVILLLGLYLEWNDGALKWLK
nr:NADH deshydrogenase subunit 3 [Xorides funiuensis]